MSLSRPFADTVVIVGVCKTHFGPVLAMIIHAVLVQLIRRTLATANRSRVSIRATKILSGAGGVVDPVKIFLSSV